MTNDINKKYFIEVWEDKTIHLIIMTLYHMIIKWLNFISLILAHQLKGEFIWFTLRLI